VTRFVKDRYNLGHDDYLGIRLIRRTEQRSPVPRKDRFVRLTTMCIVSVQRPLRKYCASQYDVLHRNIFVLTSL
jgi:hypothetical protein